MVPSNFQGCGEMKAASFPHGLLLIFQRCVTKVRRFWNHVGGLGLEMDFPRWGLMLEVNKETIRCRTISIGVAIIFGG
jgi:hypothetical protein